MNKKSLYKGLLPEDREAILKFYRIDSISDLAAMLCQVPEEDLWQLVRDCLLSIRTGVALGSGESPYARAIEYLYTLVRFVETSMRFPSKEEQGKLFEELLGQTTQKEGGQIVPLATMLREASKSPKSRKAIRQLREMARDYREEGQELPDAPDRYEGGAEE